VRAVIIENEKKSYDLLSQILGEYCPDIDLLSGAKTIVEGIVEIDSKKPDIVFFDIELNDGKCFEIFDKLEFRSFKVIFTTAYDEYAIKAFQYDAIDYILKPYTPSQVVKAVSKARLSKQKDMKFDELKAILLTTGIQKRSISVSTSDGIDVLRVDDIIRCEADGTYCKIVLMDGSRKLVSRALGEIEKQLEFTNQFVRTHTSHLVNLSHVIRLSTKDGGVVYLSNQELIPLSRRKKKEFVEALNTRV
jgi:two-component system LytT family response regulator